MRKQFISDDQADTYESAREIAPWAAIIDECDGGFWAFESADDHTLWANQI